MHPARRLIEAKKTARESSALAVPLVESNIGMEDTPAPEDVAMPTKKIAEMVIAGTMSAAALGLDTFYTPARLAETYPDIIQGDTSKMTLWEVSAIRKSTSKGASNRYVFVEALAGLPSRGLYHVSEFVSGKMVCSVERHNGRTYHDVVSILETEHALGSQMFDLVRDFIHNPTQTLLAKSGIEPAVAPELASAPQPTAARRKQRMS